MVGIARPDRGATAVTLHPVLVNGVPGPLARDAEGNAVAVLTLDVADGLVTAVRIVVNPDKLAHLQARDPRQAERILARLHEAQAAFYAGGPREPLHDVLTEDIVWVVPGRNAIAGEYRGLDAVIDYFTRRGAIAARSFRMHPGQVLVGGGDHVAVLTDGTATIEGVEHRWSTLGLYRVRDDRAPGVLAASERPGRFRLYLDPRGCRSDSSPGAS